MSFLSFAQNAEDVMLWRALRDVERGFWIDVGAAEPEALSVTRAFHDRGWNGVNIEPNPSLFAQLAAARPGDVNLRLALGAQAGRRNFHVVGDTGLSCFADDVAARHRSHGFQTEDIAVEVDTLAAICRRHAPADIHFLKIDVEGAEAEVIAGGDWSRYRPWIVLAEATSPLAEDRTHEAWEGQLLQAGYAFVWFDGVNRFYVANEHHAALAPAFDRPPNAHDDWHPAASEALRLRLAASEAAARDAQTARERGEAALARARHDLRGLQARLAEADARLHAAAAVEGRREGLDAALLQLLEHERAARSGVEAQAALLAQFRSELRLADAPRALRAVLPAARVLRQLSWQGAALRHRLRGGEVVPAALPGPTPQAALAAPGLAAPGLATSTLAASALATSALATSAAAIAAPAPSPAAALASASAAVELAPRRIVARRPIGTVHLYHHATADGDAVSNSLFVMRAMLRRAGFRSEIFARHPHPAHAGDIRPLAEMPAHDDIVLIVHHSLGDPEIDRLLALPAPIVLFYHNITPAPLLAEQPELAELARLGRAQLALWRDRAVAALAPSAVNAMELRRRGFAQPVAVCQTLVDLAALRGRAAAVGRLPAAVFTVLFVGRLVASKGQLDLLEAFRTFRDTAGIAARLVLVGHHGGIDDPYRAAIAAAAARLGVADAVELTGGITDDALDRCYAAADLYVSMSEHEGFGVPLVEAMVHGVPVLARRAGAVALTLGEAGLLVDGGPAAMGRAMAALAGDAARCEAMRRAGHRRLDALDLAQQVPALLRTLALAGALPPEDTAATALLERELHVTVAGHVNGSYSLAGVNRAVALGLEAAAPGRTSLLPVEGRTDAPLLDIADDEYAVLAELASRLPVRAAPHAVISQHYPVRAPGEAELGQDADLRCAFFFWEESLVPADMIAALEAGFDAVLAPSRFVARALIDSGLRLPVRTVGFAPPLDPYAALASRPERGHSRPFTFLHVSSAFPRKGVDVLLAAWAAAFRAEDPVRLVIKTFPNPHNDVAAAIAAMRAADAELAPIVHLDMELEDADLRTLFLGADAMVLPSRGEGFNVPAAEAMAAGLPLLVTAAGGHLDFVGPDTAVLIEGHHQPASSHLTEAGSLWFEPDRAALAGAMRALPRERAAAAARAARAREGVLGALAPDRFAARVRGALADLLMAPAPAPARRIAVVTSWGVRCGIAEYTRFLLGARVEDAVATTILSDRRIAAEPGVVPCWTAGDPANAPDIAAAVAAADPDILLIEHHPGLLTWDTLAAVLRDRRVRGRVVAVTLHNTRHLATLDAATRQRVRTALAEATRVIVHTPAELDGFRMEDLANVTFIPQGAPPLRQSEAACTPHAGVGPVIGAYGFLLPPKGFGTLIEAFRLILADHPQARLRMVTAFYDASSEQLHAALVARAKAEGVADAIDWHTSFLPPRDSLRLLAGCDVVALPYEPTLEASSAALRTVLASGRPTLVTPIEIFREAGDAVHVAAGHDAAAIRDGLADLLGDEALRGRVMAAQAAWVGGREWTRIARRTFGMLDALFRNADEGPRRAREVGQANPASVARAVDA